MSLQEIIVTAIGFFCAIYAGMHLFSYFRSIKNNDSSCAGCSGCDLHRMKGQGKQKGKERKQGKSKKSCCK